MFLKISKGGRYRLYRDYQRAWFSFKFCPVVIVKSYCTSTENTSAKDAIPQH